MYRLKLYFLHGLRTYGGKEPKKPQNFTWLQIFSRGNVTGLGTHNHYRPFQFQNSDILITKTQLVCSQWHWGHFKICMSFL